LCSKASHISASRLARSVVEVGSRDSRVWKSARTTETGSTYAFHIEKEEDNQLMISFFLLETVCWEVVTVGHEWRLCFRSCFVTGNTATSVLVFVTW
jgi:hypothetical protein